MAKMSYERWKTYKNVFDEFTLRTLFKLSTQGHFDFLEQPIMIGKESNVFMAKKGDDKVVVKIYRLETCDFNRMYEYIRTDPRYQQLKKQKRKIIFAWCQREYRNLLKAREAGVTVPTPHTFLNNVLVEEFIGDGNHAAPQLKNAVPEDLGGFFELLMDNLKTLYAAGLVHTDLSGFNILNYNERPVVIDFSGCAPTSSPNAEEYLIRDCENVAKFFSKHGLTITGSEIVERLKKQS